MTPDERMTVMKNETIAAIATAVSNSGISIIRISGEDAISVADCCFYTKSHKQILKNVPSHTIHYGFIYDGEEFVDEVMVSVMKAPKSFTTEDTVEINCHGGMLVTRKVLDTIIKHGARLAQPGEFTKRAFLHGRIDLTKAEAVMDFIEAESDFALQNSAAQLKGDLFEKIDGMRKKIIYEIAFIESAIDDPEHISLDGYSDRLANVVSDVLLQVEHLLSKAEDGRIMKEGIRTVIVGKPNAGKSSFLNTLLGYEKAIVTDIAGTTRDVLEETIRLKGVTLHLIDTAGIRQTDNLVEKIGVDRAKEYAKHADLILYVVDASDVLTQEDMEIMQLLQDKKCMVLLNKSDLKTFITEEDMRLKLLESGLKINPVIIKTSAKEKLGIDNFENKLEEMFFSGKIDFHQEIYITNLRHKEALYQAKESLILVQRSIADDMPEDFYSIDLMNAYTSLGLIIGEEVEDDLAQEIFSKFCMGK